MKSKITVILIFISLNSSAWDFVAKGNVQQSSTSNVNNTSTGAIADKFTAIDGYLQEKNDFFKFKIKGKKEQYKSQTANDNYAVDFSVQYKHSKSDDYTIGVFKQVYNGASIISTDTTSDNNGGRISATFTKEFNPDTSLYFSPTFTSKKYPKIASRTDKILTGALGVEYNFSPDFMINPEFDLQNNNSSDSYYGSTSVGPTLTLSYTPNDFWEFFADASYSATVYTGRVLTQQPPLNPRIKPVYEKQNLTSTDIGVTCNLISFVSLTAKYAREKNTSNNPTSAYKANVGSFGFGLKF
jgi:hypothetical protein